ncbi:hypothetical protein PUN4_330109 [Paraburkholderia unamae]|nr:hypothetical protein PUN4_330109 [Paraburkholderia unamae]
MCEGRERRWSHHRRKTARPNEGDYVGGLRGTAAWDCQESCFNVMIRTTDYLCEPCGQSHCSAQNPRAKKRRSTGCGARLLRTRPVSLSSSSRGTAS